MFAICGKLFAAVAFARAIGCYLWFLLKILKVFVFGRDDISYLVQGCSQDLTKHLFMGKFDFW